MPDGCTVHVLAGRSDDVGRALERWPTLVGAGRRARPARAPSCPSCRRGALTAEALAAAVGALLPEGAIVADEAITSGCVAAAATAGCAAARLAHADRRRDRQGLPVAHGRRGRLPRPPGGLPQADGSAMYTLQSLWTQAREELDVTTVILQQRLLRDPQHRAAARRAAERPATGRPSCSTSSRPDLDFVALATGMGVPATRATTGEELADQLGAAFAEPGPHLIDAILAPRF